MTFQDQIDSHFRELGSKVLAHLVRHARDFDLAEDATQEAFSQALIQWPHKGIPHNPLAWLISVGRFKIIDVIRASKRKTESEKQVLQNLEEIHYTNRALDEQEIEDDQLRLIFTCCHPAIDPKVQVPLTLREVCGLTTEEIASTFLVGKEAMAQRLVRGKRKIRQAAIPFKMPEADQFESRLEAVLSVIYLVFNEGYSSSSGKQVQRTDLAWEAIRLARLLEKLCPDSEVKGLLALMLLHQSREKARSNSDGDIVLLEQQDRAAWDLELIGQGTEKVGEALASKSIGFYTLQAAISAVHAASKSAEETDWAQILALYDLLLQVDDSPVVALNRAVALSMVQGPEAGLEIIEHLLPQLGGYFPLQVAKAEMHLRLDERQAALDCFQQALKLPSSEPEQRHIKSKIKQLQTIIGSQV